MSSEQGHRRIECNRSESSATLRCRFKIRQTEPVTDSVRLRQPELCGCVVSCEGVWGRSNAGWASIYSRPRWGRYYRHRMAWHGLAVCPESLKREPELCRLFLDSWHLGPGRQLVNTPKAPPRKQRSWDGTWDGADHSSAAGWFSRPEVLQRCGVSIFGEASRGQGNTFAYPQGGRACARLPEPCCRG